MIRRPSSSGRRSLLCLLLPGANQVVKGLTKSDSKIVQLDATTDDPHKRKPDISLAKKELGWEPRVPVQAVRVSLPADEARDERDYSFVVCGGLPLLATVSNWLCGVVPCAHKHTRKKIHKTYH